MNSRYEEFYNLVMDAINSPRSGEMDVLKAVGRVLSYTKALEEENALLRPIVGKLGRIGYTQDERFYNRYDRLIETYNDLPAEIKTRCLEAYQQQKSEL